MLTTMGRGIACLREMRGETRGPSETYPLLRRRKKGLTAFRESAAANVQRENRALRNYELAAVLDATRTEEDIQSCVEQLREILKAHNCDITYVEPWGRRKMSYPIKKRTDGYYVIFYFRSDGSPAKELERFAHINEVMIRHILVKVPHLKTEADARREEALKEAERKAREEADQKAAERAAQARAEAEAAAAAPPAQEAAVEAAPTEAELSEAVPPEAPEGEGAE